MSMPNYEAFSAAQVHKLLAAAGLRSAMKLHGERQKIEAQALAIKQLAADLAATERRTRDAASVLKMELRDMTARAKIAERKAKRAEKECFEWARRFRVAAALARNEINANKRKAGKC